MKITPVHPEPPKSEHKMPFVPALAVEGGRTIWLAGCGPIPIYHKHPHDPFEEAEWLAGGFRTQCEKTFDNVEKILTSSGGDLTNIVKLTIYVTNVFRDQNELNEITWERFGRENMPPRTLVEVSSLSHGDMLIEIDAIAVVP